LGASGLQFAAAISNLATQHAGALRDTAAVLAVVGVGCGLGVVTGETLCALVAASIGGDMVRAMNGTRSWTRPSAA